MISTPQLGLPWLTDRRSSASEETDVCGKGASGIAVTHDGKFLLAANEDTGDLSIIDRVTGKLRARVPIGPSTEMVRVQRHTAYVTFEPPTDKGGLAHIAIVDLDRQRVVASVPSGHETEGLEFSADGKSLLVANEGDDTISIYSLPGGTPLNKVRTVSYGTRPRGIKRLPEGSGYVVSLRITRNGPYHRIQATRQASPASLPAQLGGRAATVLWG